MTRPVSVVRVVAAFALSAISTIVLAQVTVTDPWVRGTVPKQQSTGAFMHLDAAQQMRLVGASSPVAGVVELHEMVLENDVMRMRQIPGIDIAPGRTMTLKPGSYHVMLMALKQTLSGGQTVPITLVFEDSDGRRTSQTIQAPVAPLGAQH